ncbi:ZFP64 zinc finger protein [Phyllostomus discolor]|nr:ZFP64 zinc finger protein [Phyllostomus discolor]
MHMRCHTSVKPHKCHLCDYAAVDSSSLKKHLRIHSDERPYQCQLCPYASRNSSQLTVHLRSHTAALLTFEAECVGMGHPVPCRRFSSIPGFWNPAVHPTSGQLDMSANTAKCPLGVKIPAPAPHPDTFGTLWSREKLGLSGQLLTLKSQLCPLQAVEPVTSPPLCLSFLVCKMGMLILSSWASCEDERTPFM